MTEPAEIRDAWELHADLLRATTRYWHFRGEIDILANGPGRQVVVDGRTHNVRTVRGLIAALEAACAFVEAVNPRWADYGTMPSEPVELVCERGHRTWGDPWECLTPCYYDLGPKFAPWNDSEPRSTRCSARTMTADEYRESES